MNIIRIAISCEGLTEKNFVNKVLTPYFSEKYYCNQNSCSKILIKPSSLDGSVSIDSAFKQIEKLVNSHHVITTLYDFYGFQKRKDFSPENLEQILLDKLNSYKDKFIPYIQKYEFEALLFSDLEILASSLGKVEKTNELKKLIKEFSSPENINGNRDTCPSRRIQKIFPLYDKVFYGETISKNIGLTKIRQECPRFNSWIEKIEKKIEEKISNP